MLLQISSDKKIVTDPGEYLETLDLASAINIRYKLAHRAFIDHPETAENTNLGQCSTDAIPAPNQQQKAYSNPNPNFHAGSGLSWGLLLTYLVRIICFVASTCWFTISA